MSTYDQQILEILGDTQGGFTTGDIAKRVSRSTRLDGRTHTWAVRSHLLELEKKGLVGRLDNEKPVVWCKREQAVKTE